MDWIGCFFGAVFLKFIGNWVKIPLTCRVEGKGVS